LKNDNLIITRAKNQFLYSGNRKILDFSLSSGAMILGHSNKIYCKSVREQLNKGSNYSNKNINEVDYIKSLKKKFKEFDNFIFSNSGSEANIRALRISRTTKNKEIVAMVNGSWHGSVDNFMFDFKNGKKIIPNKIKSLSSGIDHLKKSVLLIPYNDIKLTKKILDKYHKKISAIVIEPIQCGIPYKKSNNYLKFLEKYCRSKKIILWFDEVITGMRVRDYAVYKQFKLKPDIVTFAKCFGGGMPLGLTMFNSKLIMNSKKKIFFGGTFSGNPLSTKVGLDTFTFIKKNKKKIDKHINYLSNLLKNEINYHCKEQKINFKIQSFESIARPIFSSQEINNRFLREKFDPNFKNSLKLKAYLLKKNIFISSNCCFFISYCHNKRDINNLINILKDFLSKNHS
tara:strand:- start:1046 stop:2245 length:1200 start_codon:yes stop_codon:yes gene_type:complete